MLAQTKDIGFGILDARSGKEVKLAMQRLHLGGRILPVGARLVVHHQFRSGEKEPIEVIYTFPLPRDAALRRFRVSGEHFSMRSELKRVKEAMDEYEKGISDGHLSALARPYQDGLVSLTLGNIRPGETVLVSMEIIAGVDIRDDGLRFRFPFTLSPCYYSQAKYVTVAPGVGEIELPENEFDDLILPNFLADASGLHQVSFDLRVSMSQPLKEVGSPSHAISVQPNGDSSCRVKIATNTDVPTRDLVLDVTTRMGATGILAGTGKDGKGHFAMMLPSSRFGKVSEKPRRVVFLLDRSGSMSGAPFNQARKAINACLGILREEDQFGMVVFDDKPWLFTKWIAPGNMDYRKAAEEYLEKVPAGGGTELVAGFMEAVKVLGNKSGDIFLLTDGQVSGTDKILAKAKATGIRIHCLGIGAASQDRFLALLARETGGVSRFVGPQERVDLSALDLFASMSRPLATELEVKNLSADPLLIEPKPSKDVFAGIPILVWGETPKAGDYDLELNWSGESGNESLRETVHILENGPGETIRLLHGARLITDLEIHLPGRSNHPAAQRRMDQRIENRLQSLSETYGLASRMMALVAVVERPGDQPGMLPTTKVVPVGMPRDITFEAYFNPPSFKKIANFNFMRELCKSPSAPIDEVEFLRRIWRSGNKILSQG